jgi:glycosyltransferase involved in cell wall biosynthesis
MDPRPILILPSYNEGPTLGAILQDLAAHAAGFEIVVIDDGSQDDTGEVAAACGATVIRHPFNLGYGGALQTGYKYALARAAPLLVQMDADGQHDPAQIADLVAPIQSGQCDLVVGSRFLEPTGYRMGLWRTLGRWSFRAIARLAGLRVSDPTSGFQAMSRRALEVYVRDFFPMDYPDVNVLLAAYRRGLQVQEVSVEMSPAGRPSTLHGGVRSFYYVYKMLLSTWVASASRREES